MSDPEKKAVVLLSGGLDSATALAVAPSQGFACYALTLAYGQRHDIERVAAQRVARHLGVVAHREMVLDLAAFGGSALTDTTLAVPENRAEAEMAAGIPITYVPAQYGVSVVGSGVGGGVREFRYLHGRQRGRLFGVSGLSSGVHRGICQPGESGDEGRRRGAREVRGAHAADSDDEGGDHSPGIVAGG